MGPGPAYGYSDKTPEQRERIYAVEAAAEQVFGNHITASAWLRTFTPAVMGARQIPLDAAADSVDGLGAALAELERLRPLTEPQPLPKILQPGGRKKRRWR